ncbi:hypothetical protein LCGC14_0358730 [marine sediment metagenome]|uniref:Terminase n=1 Tax=marine sediment metagenome TaxID=412755 RepID=A0A0F9WGT4_9ZZZZ
MAKKPKKNGRPTKFNAEVKRQAKLLAEKGFTDVEIGDIFGVTEQTINNWKKRYPGFFESIKKGKEIADQKVVMALYERACGYSHPEIHFSAYEGEVTKTPHIKHYPPDTAAAFIWLKNRAGWTDKQEYEHSVDINVEIVGYGSKTQNKTTAPL